MVQISLFVHFTHMEFCWTVPSPNPAAHETKNGMIKIIPFPEHLTILLYWAAPYLASFFHSGLRQIRVAESSHFTPAGGLNGGGGHGNCQCQHEQQADNGLTRLLHGIFLRFLQHITRFPAPCQSAGYSSASSHTLAAYFRPVGVVPKRLP